MLRVIMLLLGVVTSIDALAFPCFITMVKASCWADYTVTVSVTKPGSDKKVATIVIPIGKSWIRQAFSCEPADTLSLKATFTPTIWESDEGRIYSASRDWRLPQAVVKGDTAWNIPVCFPNAFSEVPVPPNASGDCGCVYDDIPPVKPQ